ncbi:IQ domain-containing protein E [Apodemus speciosus]|uniref:IQ domain-containing protein E n=1 Tax=Apodemus speciosus TaxID=105296 RepID=A0ABQ0EUG3_APOSI
MSLGTTDLASETGDDSLSAITFDSDIESTGKQREKVSTNLLPHHQ